MSNVKTDEGVTSLLGVRKHYVARLYLVLQFTPLPNCSL